MWECKTGADQKPTTSENPETRFAIKKKQSSTSEDDLDDAAIAMASGSKPRIARQDYVEVWTCKTGQKVYY